MNEGFPEKSKTSIFKIKKLNQISSKSKSLTIEHSQSMRWCAPVEFLCRSACTLSALRRSYLRVGFRQRGNFWPTRWNSIIGRKSPAFVDFRTADTEKFGQGLRSVLLAWIFRPLHTSALDVQPGPLPTLEKCTVSCFSMADLRESRKRLECFYFSRKADIYD